MTRSSSIDRAQEHGQELAARESMPSALRATLAGAFGGLIGTGTMSALMLMARRAGLMGRLPPERITQRIFFRGRQQRRQREKNVLASLLHVGFGVAAGGLFGIAHQRLFMRARLAELGALGIAYGMVIWTVSYMGWVPALRLMPPAHRDRPDRPIVMIAAHWLFGATLGMVTGLLDPPHAR